MRSRSALRLPHLLTMTLATLLGASAPAHAEGVAFRPIGSYASGAFDDGGAEVTAYDPGGRELYGTNNVGGVPRLDVLDLSDPSRPALARTIDLAEFGGEVTSVAVRPTAWDPYLRRHITLVAAAVANEVKTDPGRVVLFDGRASEPFSRRPVCPGPAGAYGTGVIGRNMPA